MCWNYINMSGNVYKLSKVYKESTTSQGQVSDWHKLFSEGKEDFHDDS
jgi:hypothetical protein